MNTTRSNGSAGRDKHLTADLQEVYAKQIDLPTGEEILDEEMKNSENHDIEYGYPEIQNYSQKELEKTLTNSIWKELRQEIDEDKRLNEITEEVLKERWNLAGRKLLAYVFQKAKRINRNEFSNKGTTKPTEEINHQFALMIVERILWVVGRKYKIPQREKDDLISYRYRQTKDQKNPMEIVQAFYPKLEQEAMSQTKKLEILTKVSILMMILPVPKVDEFIERNIFIDKMLQWADFKTAVDYTLKSSLQFEIKNHGHNYNYRIEEFINFLENAKNLVINKPRWVKWVKEAIFLAAQGPWIGPSVLSNYQWRYDATQRRLKAMQELGATDAQLYNAYLYVSHIEIHNLRKNHRALNENEYWYLSSFDTLPNEDSISKEVNLFRLKHRKNLPDYVRPNLHIHLIFKTLKRLEVTLKEMYDAWVSAEVLFSWWRNNFRINELHKSWISVREMLEWWIRPQDIHTGWITYKDQYEAGITLQELYAAWVSLSEMYKGGIHTKVIEEELFSDYPPSFIENLRNGSKMYSDGVFIEPVQNDSEFDSLFDSYHQDRSNERMSYIKELEKLKKIKLSPAATSMEIRFLNVDGRKVTLIQDPFIFKQSVQHEVFDSYKVLHNDLSKLLKKQNLTMCKDTKSFEEFINNNIPWSSFQERLINLARLMHLDRNGIINDNPEIDPSLRSRFSHYSLRVTPHQAIIFDSKKHLYVSASTLDLENTKLSALCIEPLLKNRKVRG